MPPFRLAELLAAWLLMSAMKLFQANQMSNRKQSWLWMREEGSWDSQSKCEPMRRASSISYYC